MQTVHSAMMKTMQSGTAIERLDARTAAMQELNAIRPLLVKLLQQLQLGGERSYRLDLDNTSFRTTASL